jgi:hypothetical protein
MLGNIVQTARLANEIYSPRQTAANEISSPRRQASGGGCCGIVGLLMGISLLFWNEGRSARQYGTIQEGLKKIVNLDNIQNIDPKNEGKLIHLTGMLDALSGPLKDSEFGVSAPALLLKREAQIYEWGESVTDYEAYENNATITKKSYSYQKSWSSFIRNSDYFYDSEGHLNPTSMRFQSKSFNATQINVGAFVVPTTMSSSLSAYSTLTGISIDNIPAGSSASDAKTGQDYDFFYFGVGDPDYPEVGDHKVSYRYHPSGVQYSIMAQQTGDSFTEYKTHAGGSWFVFQRGSVTAEEMFTSAQAVNDVLTMILRLLGFFILFTGCNSMLSPLLVVGGWIPCVGTCLADTIIPFVSMVVSCGVYGLVVGIAWLYYRPLVSLPLILGIVGLGYLMWNYYEKNKEMQRVATDDAIEEFEDGLDMTRYSDEKDETDDKTHPV